MPRMTSLDSRKLAKLYVPYVPSVPIKPDIITYPEYVMVNGERVVQDASRPYDSRKLDKLKSSRPTYQVDELQTVQT